MKYLLPLVAVIALGAGCSNAPTPAVAPQPAAVAPSEPPPRNALEAALQAKRDAAETSSPSTSASSTPTQLDAKDLQPAVAYIRAGRLSALDKVTLQKKLIEPATAYYNEKEKKLVSIMITAPETSKLSFDVVFIMKDGSNESFGYGSLGEDTFYWVPDCMDAESCNFSPAFIKKYPQITVKYGVK